MSENLEYLKTYGASIQGVEMQAFSWPRFEKAIKADVDTEASQLLASLGCEGCRYQWLLLQSHTDSQGSPELLVIPGSVLLDSLKIWQPRWTRQNTTLER